jgi:hypothetical protein
MPPHVPYGLRGLPSQLWPKCNRLLRMGRSYVVPMRWMVIYEYEVPGGALNLNSTRLPRPWSPWGSSPSRKNPHGRTWNRTRGIMISSQKLWPLDHEAGRTIWHHIPEDWSLKREWGLFSIDRSFSALDITVITAPWTQSRQVCFHLICLLVPCVIIHTPQLQRQRQLIHAPRNWTHVS